MTVPFIVMSAPNGARRGKDDNPTLPTTAPELATCAEQVLDAGASILHLHVRDETGGHTLDPDRYREALDAIRARVDDRLLLQITTESCGLYAPEEQEAVVRDLKPEAVSIALRELCADADGEKKAAEFFAWLNDNDVMTQYILYSSQEVQRFEKLRTRGVVPQEWPFVLLVLGRYADSRTGDASQLPEFVAPLSPDVCWAVCCFGETESDAVIAAAEMNGHARVGFENNLLLPDGSRAPDNAALVRLAASRGEQQGRRVADADDVRHMLC